MALEAILIDSGGQTTAMAFPGATEAQLADVEHFLDTYSSAGLIGVNEVLPVAVTPKAAASGADLDRRAILQGKGDTSGESYRIVILAPLFSGQMSDEGERVPTETGQDIFDDWAAMTDEGITFTGGIIVERE